MFTMEALRKGPSPINITLSDIQMAHRPNPMKFIPSRALKRLWPDLKHMPHLTPGKQFGFLPNFPEVLKGLGVQEHDKIMGLGIRGNDVIDMICNNRYPNARDMTLAAFEARFTPTFRELPLNETFRAICFDQVLDHLPGGYYSRQTSPSLQLLADKIYLHLEPNGYLIFSDFAKNTFRFSECLLKAGFQYKIYHARPLHIFRKV